MLECLQGHYFSCDGQIYSNRSKKQNPEESIYQISFTEQGKNRTWEEMEGDKNDLIKYKQFEKKINHLIRQIQVQTELGLIRRANLNGFYKYINRQLFNHTSLGVIQCNNNSLTSDPEKIVNIFNDYFASVFTSDDENTPDFCTRTNTQTDNIVFTPEIVTRILKTLNSSTSTGSDNISNVLLKKCAHCLALPLFLMCP